MILVALLVPILLEVVVGMQNTIVSTLWIYG